jgi:hypothetical protein
MKRGEGVRHERGEGVGMNGRRVRGMKGETV